MSGLAMPDDLSPEALAVDRARLSYERDPGTYLAALAAFADVTGSWVRVPGLDGAGRWLSPREARAARAA